MICICGCSFDINPLSEEGQCTGPIVLKSQEIETMTTNIIDAKKSHSIVLIIECPFCQAAFFKKIYYTEFIELPKQGSLDAMENFIGMVGCAESGEAGDSGNMGSSLIG